MIVHILNDDKTYYSLVFAINLSKNYSKAIVFDKRYLKLIVSNIEKSKENNKNING